MSHKPYIDTSLLRLVILRGLERVILRGLMRVILRAVAGSTLRFIDSATTLRFAQNDNGGLRFAQNDNGDQYETITGSKYINEIP